LQANFSGLLRWKAIFTGFSALAFHRSRLEKVAFQSRKEKASSSKCLKCIKVRYLKRPISFKSLLTTRFDYFFKRPVTLRGLLFESLTYLKWILLSSLLKGLWKDYDIDISTTLKCVLLLKFYPTRPTAFKFLLLQKACFAYFESLLLEPTTFKGLLHFKAYMPLNNLLLLKAYEAYFS
jgi:hypothetical protein